MLTLAQLSSNLKRQTGPNDLINKETQSDPSTYRFIQVRGSSFRTKSKDSRIQLKDTNSVHYDFRGHSFVDTDEQTCTQFKVPELGGTNSRQPILLCESTIIQLSVHLWSYFWRLCVQVMMLGDSGVGKSCLLIRFKDKTFMSGSYIATIGIDYRVKTLIRLAHLLWLLPTAICSLSDWIRLI